MAKKKNGSRIIKKELEELKPVKIISKIKEEKNQKEEELKNEKKEEKADEAEQEQHRVSQFSERILSEGSPRRFTAPVLGMDEQKPGNLEETAAMAPASAPSSAAENKPAYAPSSISYSGSGAYEKKEREKYSRSESTRPVFAMGEDRRANIPAVLPIDGVQRARMSAAKSAEQAQMDEFARQQEKYLVERQESTSLPFERKSASRRKTEIF